MNPPVRLRSLSPPGLLTATGRALGALGVGAYLGGVLLGWTELVVLAAACLLACVSGVPFVLGRHRLTVERSLRPERVSVGDEAEAVLRIGAAPGRLGSRWSGLMLEDQVDGRRVALALPSAKPDAMVTIRHRLPTDRRGVYPIGPVVAAKADLLGLLKREVRQTGTDQLWVRPRLAAVPPLPTGFAKDLEGPTSDSSPAGDVSFHALRSYEPGDDHRHIHWLSSARAGALMVRHHVDNRLPRLTVLLDDRAGPGFETAVEIAASIVTGHEQRGLPVSVVLGDRVVLTAGIDQLLDQFCLVRPRVASAPAVSLAHWVDRALTTVPDTSALIIVTAAATADEVAQACGRAYRRARPLTVRVGGEPLPARIGQATILRVESLDEFAIAWSHEVRA